MNLFKVSENHGIKLFLLISERGFWIFFKKKHQQTTSGQRKKKTILWKSYVRGYNHNVFLDDWIHFHFHLLRNKTEPLLVICLSTKIPTLRVNSSYLSVSAVFFFLFSLIQVIWPSLTIFPVLMQQTDENKFIQPWLYEVFIIEPVFISFTFTFYILVVNEALFSLVAVIIRPFWKKFLPR